MDFRIRVFLEVAKYLSFTRASKELYISQPAISKHIQELENTYNVQLFNRQGGKIELTHQGEIFRQHAQRIVEEYNKLSCDMEMLSGSFSGELRIGASTTIAQYLIAPLMADFISKFPNVKCTLLTGNSEQIENALEKHSIDIGLVEGSKRRPNLKYQHFAKDELVLVTSSRNILADSIVAADIQNLPLVLRELGSGTLEVIENALLNKGIKLSGLNILLHIGSTEGIKKFLESSAESYAILSIISVLKELKNNELKVIDIEDMEMQREFAFVMPQGGQNERIEKFISFANLWYSSSYML